MLKTEAIKTFLTAATHNDLAALYNPDMEVQVNAAKDHGELVHEEDYKGRKWCAWTDNIETWKSFRIPHNAKTTPEYTDSDLRFSLERHAEGIGLTGWDYKHKLSRWVAFDFDAIVGHSTKHTKKLTETELQEIREIVHNIPYVTLRLSTSGKGLHVYVFLDPVPTENHTEHAALARAVLSLLSAKVGFDFYNAVDICGGIMWVWHRKMLGTDGLTLLKKGEQLYKVPQNWRDHVPVIVRRTRTSTVDVGNVDDFTILTSKRQNIRLDDQHKKLIDFLNENNHYWHWDQDSWMLVTHTFGLKQAHKELGLRGKFDTESQGTEQGIDKNCFMFPIDSGGWRVFRFGQGCQEHELWTKDEWTWCYYNRPLDVPTAARISEGVLHEKEGYMFSSARKAFACLQELGFPDKVPDQIVDRPCRLKFTKDRITVSVEFSSGNDSAMPGWYRERKNWVRVFEYKTEDPSSRRDFSEIIRHITSETGEDAGWVIKRNGIWCDEPLGHVKLFLSHLGEDAKTQNLILGSCVEQAWKIVCKPFQEEYLGERMWNRNSPKLKVVPTLEKPHYPTYKSILEHLGQSLTPSIKEHAWCKENGIESGADYLKLWLACILKAPDQPLPYLGFYGPQNSGKSTFHEMLNFIIEGGIAFADTALINPQGFNGELQNSVVCIVEETDLGKSNKIANNRIKDWVTSPYIMIHAKNYTPTRAQNTTHWIQVANYRDYFPLFPGDTRITLIYVPPLNSVLGRREMDTRLRKEAPDFTAALLGMEIPELSERLMVPVINTADKEEATKHNQSTLEKFIDECCHNIPGTMISVANFYDRFQAWLQPGERPHWTKNRISRELPPQFAKGKSNIDMVNYYGNMTFNPQDEPGTELCNVNGYLRPKRS